MSPTPTESYGIIQRKISSSYIEQTTEQVRNLGYAIFNPDLEPSELKDISDEFDLFRARYVADHGEVKLREMNELHTIRSPLSQGGNAFLRLALNQNLLSLLRNLISGKFILNQQNGIVNPPSESYNQRAWHRDFPYQHFVSSKPLAINALFCVDDFTVKNGATFVLPASHKSEEFPSLEYVKRNALQIEAKRGSFIVLDCMAFHTGGFNQSGAERRAVNHVYNIPFFKQQIRIAGNLNGNDLSAEEREILGFNYLEPQTVQEYLSSRNGKPK